MMRRWVARPEAVMPLVSILVVLGAFGCSPLLNGKPLQVFDVYNALQGFAQLGLLALAILFLSMRGEEGETTYLGHRNVLIVLAALAGLAFAFERADSYLVLGTFMAVILLLVARASLWKVLLAALVTIVLVWAIFTLALGVRLPAGDFWDTLRGLAITKTNGR